MSSDMTTVEQAPVPQVSDDRRLWASASIATVHEQVGMIKKLMKEEMEEGIHYGKIPGTDKPTLLQPGAQKLCLLFRLSPHYKIKRYDLENGHREYEVICELTHSPSGTLIAEGVGLCTTMEKRYRYRNQADLEDTGVAVPKPYWNARERGDRRAMQQHLQDASGVKGNLIPKKVDGAWTIHVKKGGERVENPDIADCYNTVFKIGKKRALIDACLTGTAASDLFTQDLEDFADDDRTPAGTPLESAQRAHAKPAQEQPAQNGNGSQQSPDDWTARLSQRFKQMKCSRDDCEEIVSIATGGEKTAVDCKNPQVAMKVHAYLAAHNIKTRDDLARHVESFRTQHDEPADQPPSEESSQEPPPDDASQEEPPAQFSVEEWERNFRGCKSIEGWAECMQALVADAGLTADEKKRLREYANKIKSEKGW